MQCLMNFEQCVLLALRQHLDLLVWPRLNNLGLETRGRASASVGWELGWDERVVSMNLVIISGRVIQLICLGGSAP